MHGRYILNIFVVILLIAAPWWIFLLAVAAGAFLMHSYYELILFSAMYDLLYAGSIDTAVPHVTATAYGLVMFCIAHIFRHNFNLHEKRIARYR